jgi:Predicted signal transduction protein with a C-terminal ATPase domain
MSLKRRIVIIFALCMLVPFICTTAVSYVAISSIMRNKTKAEMQDGVRQTQMFLENAVRNLGHISQQLTMDGAVGSMVDSYLESPNSFERSRLKLAIRNELNLISFTNPNVGLIMYYFDDGTISRDLENIPVKDGFSIGKLPVLASYYGISYFGPHLSQDRFSDQYVLSALRKVGSYEGCDIYVYVESGFKLTESILAGDRLGARSLHLLLDNDGRIAYSEVPVAFPVNAYFSPSSAQGGGSENGYYWFKATGNQGWSVVSLVPAEVYNLERNRWAGQIAMLSLVFILFGAFLSLVMLRTVYKPLSAFSAELAWLDGRASIPVVDQTGIPEFDALLDELRAMKSRITLLMTEIEQKEKRRSELEIENLLFQINPHFLMNSLYTIHWIAVGAGQEEIDRYVLALNRLLCYNLGKMGSETSLREELESLDEYLLLQKSRYDFELERRMLADEGALSVRMPRFVLQPLVENALLHGQADSLRIEVGIERRDGEIEVSVSDDGPGIPEDKLRALLEGGDEPSSQGRGSAGMGIGLRYVRRALERFYGGRASLSIESIEGGGTRATISLPATEERQ